MKMGRTEELVGTDRFGEKLVVHKTRMGWRKKQPRLTSILAYNRVLAIACGMKIEAARKRLGWTLEMAALETGAPGGHPKARQWSIENPQRGYGVHMGTLYVFADAFGCSVESLLPQISVVREIAAMLLDDRDLSYETVRAMIQKKEAEDGDE